MTPIWFLAGFATACVCWVAASCLWGPRTGPRGRGGYIDITRATKTRPHDWERAGDLYEPAVMDEGSERLWAAIQRNDLQAVVDELNREGAG